MRYSTQGLDEPSTDLSELAACSNARLLALARALLGNGLICVVLVDAAGEVGFISEVGRLAFEIDDTAPLMGRDWVSLWPEGERAKARSAILAARSGQTGRFRAYCPTAKGAARWWDAILIPLDGGAGPPGEMLAVLSDVTAIEEAAQRKAQSERLEAIGQLTGGVAHDFNNLLTVIMGNIECLMEMFPRGGEAHDMARLALTAAEKGADLVARLLAFSRRGALAPAAIDLTDLLSGLAPLVRRTIGERVRIALSVPDAALVAEVDRVQLEAAILNLCVNARDAMPMGGDLRISLDRVEGTTFGAARLGLCDGTYARIVVSDSGEGMTEETLERAIEPFFTTKDVGKGTGLGLSSAYGFLKQSGGHLAIASGPGKGTDISLYVPLGAAPAGALRLEMAA